MEVAPAEAVTAMRFGTHHFVGSFRQERPQLGSLEIYDDAPKGTIDDLTARGHKVKTVKAPLWDPTMLRIDPKSGQIQAAGDPKAGRHAAAY